MQFYKDSCKVRLALQGSKFTTAHEEKKKNYHSACGGLAMKRRREKKYRISRGYQSTLQHVNLATLWSFLWAVLGRNPVFIGRLSQATQTAISPGQTVDLPLQPLCVSCLPDGDQMKSSADDNKKHRDKSAVWRRRLHGGPSFLSRTKNNYNSSLNAATQQNAMCFAIFYANEGPISSPPIY